MALRRRICVFALAALCIAVTAYRAPAQETRPMTVAEIITVAEYMDGGDAETRAIRAKLVGSVTTQYLKHAASVKSVSLWGWRRLVMSLNRDLSGETRALWMARFRAGYVSDTHVLAPSLVIGIVDVLDALGDPGADATAADLFERVHTDKYVTWREYRDIAKYWTGRRRRPEAGKWAKRLYDTLTKDRSARAAAKPEAVYAVAELYDELGLSGKGVGHPEFAKALLAQTEKGELKAGKYQYCLESAAWSGRMLGTPKVRGILLERVSAVDGHELVGLTGALAWAHLYSGAIAEWRQFLDERIASPLVTTDGKAYWLLARGYAERIEKNPGDPFVGRPWMNRALATAESPEARLHVVMRIAMGYAFLCDLATGTSFLDSVEDQFASNAEEFALVRERFGEVWYTNMRYGAAKEALQEARKVRNRRLALGARLATRRREASAVAEREKRLPVVAE